MFGILALLTVAHAEETTVDTLYTPTTAEQSNNGNGKKKGNGKKGNGKKGGNGKGKGKGQGKKAPQKGQGNGQKKAPNAGQKKGQQGNGNVKWTKFKEENNIIFRPELGMTTLNLDGFDQSVGGANFGLSVGNEKTKRLKSANVGLYTRSRLYGAFGIGPDLNAYDFRAGSVLGVKVLHAEFEAGLDLLRHMADSDQTDVVDFRASNGFGIPVQGLFVSDLFKIKIGAEPRWYFDGQDRTAVDWSTHASADTLPVAPIGDEFAWTIGFRSGWFGLSYEQLLMNGGTQHMVSLGLQR